MTEISTALVRLTLDMALAVVGVEATLQYEVPSAQIAFSRQVAVLKSLEQFNIQEASDRREMIVFTQGHDALRSFPKARTMRA